MSAHSRGGSTVLTHTYRTCGEAGALAAVRVAASVTDPGFSFDEGLDSMSISTGKPARRRPTAGASGAIRREFGSDLVHRLDQLCSHGRSEGPVDLSRDYLAAAVAAAVGTLVGGPIVPALCAVYVGVRQRHLSNLTHECIHTKFTRSPRANRIFGHLITVTLGEPFTPYKRSHRVHHARLGSPDDPMLRSYISRNANRRWPDTTAFVVHVIIKNAAWELPKFGFLTLAAKSRDETWTAAVSRWTAWVAAIALAATCGHLTEFALYWALPLICVRPVITWLTDLGNHAGLIESDDPILQTRGWTSHALTRHLLGGHNDDMYHPIHHWCPNIGWRQLPAAADILRAEFPRWPEVPWCSGFFFRRRSTPDRPSVIEDIVVRLNSQTQQTRPIPGHHPAREERHERQ
ncbi:fatty acid desaturase [Nocardia sp. CDC159]|uniref:Fatty acid desaturase n=1 Tax=Nocardia pulmonis TaxID=2951408 RepID=A0A9X2EAC9_9NOCA|nr:MULTISPECIES: fatty acid desaturase [Nocardia]MCM6774463.1 fatty acid desaturase [Nocardia pulmonis]MCM6787471.1 fatty acid desaturase [Nocardia sp. CDC159]